MEESAVPSAKRSPPSRQSAKEERVVESNIKLEEGKGGPRARITKTGKVEEGLTRETHPFLKLG